MTLTGLAGINVTLELSTNFVGGLLFATLLKRHPTVTFPGHRVIIVFVGIRDTGCSSVGRYNGQCAGGEMGALLEGWSSSCVGMESQIRGSVRARWCSCRGCGDWMDGNRRGQNVAERIVHVRCLDCRVVVRGLWLW